MSPHKEIDFDLSLSIYSLQKVLPITYVADSPYSKSIKIMIAKMNLMTNKFSLNSFLSIFYVNFNLICHCYLLVNIIEKNNILSVNLCSNVFHAKVDINSCTLISETHEKKQDHMIILWTLSNNTRFCEINSRF